jgi:hypothetical protein
LEETLDEIFVGPQTFFGFTKRSWMQVKEDANREVANKKEGLSAHSICITTTFRE